ncbi:lipoprotein [Desulfosarcina widdelii]|uniref:Lipoprotein n=1 Tax=Desulfosarcina widdelii TaxID=947919 RepID=A0A5K7YT55_9BACT|nr:hypothetical protein [Desulfosarcina widdelii]BBO73022.1 lipoprotein [Desulfosarcina widdelii]
MRNHVILILLISLSLVMGACTITHKFGPFMGKVVDAETGEPIEGAVILIVFTIESSSLGGSVNSFADAIETLTDAQGEFKFTPKRVNYFKMNASWDDDCQVSIFKPGYGAYPGHRQAYSSWKKDEQSLVIPENEYITYYLPKLADLKERKKNRFNIREPGAIPIEKMPNMQRLQSEERVNVGLKP